MKKLLFDSFKLDLAQLIRQSLLVRWPDLALSAEEIYHLLVIPPQKEMGHFAFGVFPLAKALRLAPPVIAAQVAEVLLQNTPVSTVKLTFEKVQNVGPYVNFFFPSQVLFKEIIYPLLTGNTFSQRLPRRHSSGSTIFACWRRSAPVRTASRP